MIIDAQVHIAAKGAGHPNGHVAGKTASRHVDAAEMLEAMARVGVDAALVTGQSSRGPDNTCLLEATARYPDSFAAVGQADLSRPDIEEQLENLKLHPGVVGVRVVVLSPGQREEWRAGRFDPLFAAAERKDLPVFIYPPGLLPELAIKIKAHPRLRFFIDHLGLSQPTAFGDRDPDPFGRLPELLALAPFENVAIKLSGVPTLSMRPYPFDDLWPPLHRVLRAFGVERVIWGSDWTRLGARCSYEQAVDHIRKSGEISMSEKEMLFGGSMKKLLGWPSGLSVAAHGGD